MHPCARNVCGLPRFMHAFRLVQRRVTASLVVSLAIRIAPVITMDGVTNSCLAVGTGGVMLERQIGPCVKASRSLKLALAGLDGSWVGMAELTIACLELVLPRDRKQGGHPFSGLRVVGV